MSLSSLCRAFISVIRGETLSGWTAELFRPIGLPVTATADAAAAGKATGAGSAATVGVGTQCNETHQHKQRHHRRHTIDSNDKHNHHRKQSADYPQFTVPPFAVNHNFVYVKFVLRWLFLLIFFFPFSNLCSKSY